MGPAAGRRRAMPWLCLALAGCATGGHPVEPPPADAKAIVVSDPVPAPVPSPLSPPVGDAASVLEALDPDIWQDLHELDPDIAADLE